MKVEAVACFSAIVTLAIEQTSGRQRIIIHGAIDLETGQTHMIEVESVDAQSTIKLLASIGRTCYNLRVHELDN